MCVELHCATRNDLLPNPAEDSVLAIFVLICNDYPEGYGKPKEFLRKKYLFNAVEWRFQIPYGFMYEDECDRQMDQVF